VSKALIRSANVLALLAVVLLVASVGLLTWYQFSSIRATRISVRHTYEVIGAIDQLGIALRDADIAQRDYVLTSRDDELTSLHAAADRLVLLQGELRRLTADNPRQQDRLRALAPIIQRKQEQAARAIQLRQDSGTDAAAARIRTDRQLMNEIEVNLAAMTAEEERLLTERQRAADAAEAMTRWLALAGSLLAVGLLALSGWLLTRTRRELLQSEAEQRALAAQMRTAFDSVSQGIGVFDSDGHLLRWNDRLTALLDLPAALVQPGAPYARIAEHVASDNGLLLETADQIRHGQAESAQGQMTVYERTRPADSRSFEMRRTAMANGGYVLCVTDITERVRAEATARDAQRLQAMGQLTGGIAHDFNNLLTVIMANLELVKRRLDADSDVARRIDRALWGAHRGAALTQQLLAFARKQALVPMPIDMSATLPEMANLLRRTLGEHIEVRTVGAAGLWLALADPAQVESALLNLALNARDAMPGGGQLTIEVANKVLDAEYARRRTEVVAGDYVMLGVSDTGAGMPPEVLARAFEPFFTTKEEGKGTGLGLAMVLGFAKQSGGHVNIYSEPGEGTTVRLYLPRAVGAMLPASQRSGAPIELPHGSATILVVEDEPEVREACIAILRELGYRMLEAADGPEALRVFGENDARIDLLLTDVVLTGRMKGNELARRLTEIRPQLRVLFMSGYTENAIVHHGRLDDGVQLIGKPFQREQLARKVAAVLGAGEIAPPSARDPKVVELSVRDRGRTA